MKEPTKNQTCTTAKLRRTHRFVLWSCSPVPRCECNPSRSANKRLIGAVPEDLFSVVTHNKETQLIQRENDLVRALSVQVIQTLFEIQGSLTATLHKHFVH